jgi:hypothetical protein
MDGVGVVKVSLRNSLAAGDALGFNILVVCSGISQLSGISMYELDLKYWFFDLNVSFKNSRAFSGW